jgi:hypothetical protein
MVGARRWCMNIPAAASPLLRSDYLTRIETGMPRLVMRFRALQPIFASIC